MNRVLLILMICIFCFGCKEEKSLKTVENESDEAIVFVKEFYHNVYGLDNSKVRNHYLSDVVIKRIDSLTSNNDEVILDYDPFIQAQNFFSNVIDSTLVVKQGNRNNEYNASFLLFGAPNEKRTEVSLLVRRNGKGDFKIYSVLNNDYLNLEKSVRGSSDYFVLDSVSIKKGLHLYDIVVLEENAKKNKENVQHNSNTILIYQDEKVKYRNENLISFFDDNCPADGFQQLSSKENHFTIRQVYCKDFLFVLADVTFEIDKNTGDVYLSSYKEEYTDRSNPDKDITSKMWTQEDFGSIKFEQVTMDFLSKLK